MVNTRKIRKETAPKPKKTPAVTDLAEMQEPDKIVDPCARGKHRDFILLMIYVATQHRLYDRAYTLTQALIADDDQSVEALMAEVVLLFYQEDYVRALERIRHLERVDPVERYGKKNIERKYRMRGFLKARCLYELKPADSGEERAALELYLRQIDHS